MHVSHIENSSEGELSPNTFELFSDAIDNAREDTRNVHTAKAKKANQFLVEILCKSPQHKIDEDEYLQMEAKRVDLIQSMKAIDEK